MTEKIRLVIVDDHPLFREGVASILSGKDDFDVVAQGDNGNEAVELVKQHSPDMLLLDINIPGGGLTVVSKIAACCPAIKIVMLTASTDEDDVMTALKTGARGYILKGVAARELVSILRGIREGDSYITPTLAASVLSDMVRPVVVNEPPNPLADLTVREREVLELIASGNSNREIGSKLFLSEKTIKHYVTNILQKLHVRNRVEAALVAKTVQS